MVKTRPVSGTDETTLHVEPGSTVYTDDHAHTVAWRIHKLVKRCLGEYARAHTNSVESVMGCT